MTDRKPIITEAEAEHLADRLIWRLLNTDRAYQHAEDAESQSAREDEIGRDVWRRIEADYQIVDR